MEFLTKLFDLVASPEFYALIVALTALLVAIGKLLQAIGNIRNSKKVNADGPIIGTGLMILGEIGKFAEWVSPGNADQKNHPELLKIIRQVFKR